MDTSLPPGSGCCQPGLYQSGRAMSYRDKELDLLQSWEEQRKHQPDALTSLAAQLARWSYRGGAGGPVYGRLCLVCQASRRYGVAVGHQTWWSRRQARWELEESEDKLEPLWPSWSGYLQSNQGPLKNKHCCFPSASQITHL